MKERAVSVEEPDLLEAKLNETSHAKGQGSASFEVTCMKWSRTI